MKATFWERTRSNDAGLLMFGQLVGQGSLLLTSPLLARLYAPDLIGTYQVIVSVAIVLTPFASGGYEFRLALAGSMGDFRSSLTRSRLRIVSVSATAGLVSLAGIPFFGLIDTVALSACLALSILSYAVTVTDSAALIRQGRMGRLAIRAALQGMLASLLQLMFGLWIPGTAALVAALVIGRFLAWGVTWSGSRVESFTELGQSRPDGKSTQIVTSQVLGNLSSQAIGIAAFVALGPFAAGQLALAQRLSSAPVTLLSQGVTQVLIGSISPQLRSGTLRFTGAFRRQVEPLVGASGLVAVVTMLLGPPVTRMLLGQEWDDAATYVALLAVPTALQLIAVPMSSLFGLLDRPRTALWVQGLRCLLIGLSIPVAAQWLSDSQSIAVGAFAWATSYAVLLLLLIRVWRQHQAELKSSQVSLDDPR